MKLHDLFEDFSPESGKRLSDQQMQLAFNAVRRQELDKAEIADLARQFEENDVYGRTKESAEFLLTRMHILVHGLAPHGETERRAETMFRIPNTMIDYANRKGIDTVYNIEHAREELRNRPVRRKRPEAKKMMFDYYKANKADLPKNINQYREEIVDRLMQGISPESAFDVA